MAKVLVTGASGFIGRNLVTKLLSLGHEVHVFVLDDEYYVPDEFVKVYRGNISNALDCNRIVGRSRPTHIFHLASQPLVGTALDSPYDTLDSNIRGAYSFLDSIRLYAKEVKSIVWVTTDKVYGEMKEQASPDDVSHPYNTSKVCSDLLARMYAKVYNMPIGIVRTGNVYGMWDTNWDRLIPGTIKSIFSGESIVLRSDGESVRDYIFIDDIISAYILVLEYIETHQQEYGRAFSFGASRPSSVLDVVTSLLDVAGKVVPIEIDNLSECELSYQHIDNSDVESVLGWTPITSLLDGASKTISWYREYYG